MTKKSAGASESSSRNKQKTKADTKAKGRVLHMKNKPAAKAAATKDPRYAQAVQNYEAGLRALQERKYDRAKASFEKVIQSPSVELADRARLHLNTCNQQLTKTSTSFKSAEEQYDYAVSLINAGDYDDARAQLEKILKNNPRADFAIYGLAAVDCLTNKPEECLRNLAEAIRVNPAHRIQARNDSDFSRMSDDPRFTELLYPEPTESSSRY